MYYAVNNYRSHIMSLCVNICRVYLHAAYRPVLAVLHQWGRLNLGFCRPTPRTGLDRWLECHLPESAGKRLPVITAAFMTPVPMNNLSRSLRPYPVEMLTNLS